MQESQSFNVLDLARDTIKSYAMPTIPQWTDIPRLMGMSHDTLKFRRAPLDDILAVLEAVYYSLKGKVNSHMIGWDRDDIMKYGTYLAEIDARLELAGDELIKRGDIEACVGNLWPVFALVKECWNELFAKGCINI